MPVCECDNNYDCKMYMKMTETRTKKVFASSFEYWWNLDVFCAADVHAGAHQAARDALHRRAGMSHT